MRVLLKNVRKIIIVSGTFSLIILFRLYLFDVYKVPSTSMSPTILPGDYVLVCKMCYGPRIINIPKLVFYRTMQYKWYKGMDSIKNGDIVVFNLPIYEYMEDSEIGTFGTCLIKRCINLPGDIVKIRRGDTNPVYRDFSMMLFPFDSTLHWTLENYGPLYVPGKGENMTLSSQNAEHYKNMLLYEGVNTKIKNDSVFLDGRYATNYIFKYNYYFMLGDNFYQSNDSRYWGVVPETHIIGKGILVLFSLNPNDPWYKRIRWRRILKRIE